MSPNPIVFQKSFHLIILTGIIVILILTLMFRSEAQLICNLIGFLCPAYCSMKAIETKTKDDDVQARFCLDQKIHTRNLRLLTSLATFFQHTAALLSRIKKCIVKNLFASFGLLFLASSVYYTSHRQVLKCIHNFQRLLRLPIFDKTQHVAFHKKLRRRNYTSWLLSGRENESAHDLYSLLIIRKTIVTKR
jgi:hypothetical protein